MRAQTNDETHNVGESITGSMKAVYSHDIAPIIDNILDVISIAFGCAEMDRIDTAIRLPILVNAIRPHICNHQYREMPAHMKAAIEQEIKLLLHAQRDCFRNQGKDATKIHFFGPHDGYYCDCIGIMRCLHILGYGKFGAINAAPEPPELSAWMRRLEDEVLEEEGLHTDHRCEWCLNRYGKDDKSEMEKKRIGMYSAMPIRRTAVLYSIEILNSQTEQVDNQVYINVQAELLRLLTIRTIIFDHIWIKNERES